MEDGSSIAAADAPTVCRRGRSAEASGTQQRDSKVELQQTWLAVAVKKSSRLS